MATSDRPRPDPPAPPKAAFPEAAPRRRGNAVPIAALLIGIGVLLLALNLNLLRWGAVLAVLSLWPLALVALGVDLITRGRFRLPIWIIVIAVAVLASVGRLGPLGGVIGPAPALGGTVVEQTAIVLARDRNRALELELSTGIADLRLGALPRGSDDVLRGTINTARDQRLEQRMEPEDGVWQVSLRTESEDRFGFFGGIRTSGDDRSWNLDVAPALPLELRVDTGVGRSDLDLRDLQVTAFDVNAGVGEIDVTLPAHGGYEGSIDAGVGEITLVAPSGAAVRVEVDRGLGALELRGFEQVGDGYQTAAYAAAPDAQRALVDINGGLGAIALRAE